jgi:flagellar biosynthesis protein FlhB
MKLRTILEDNRPLGEAADRNHAALTLREIAAAPRIEIIGAIPSLARRFTASRNPIPIHLVASLAFLVGKLAEAAGQYKFAEEDFLE